MSSLWNGDHMARSYGKMSAAEIINRRTRLRKAIISEGSVKIQEAWDMYEEVLDFDLMMHREDANDLNPGQ
jgi:hypothetical protein